MKFHWTSKNFRLSRSLIMRTTDKKKCNSGNGGIHIVFDKCGWNDFPGRLLKSLSFANCRCYAYLSKDKISDKFVVDQFVY
ncbi:MAG: hypothetical protein AVO38_11570 [delta proteobacterium ML8_D]|nr:MAG: hypothetical protein AVO38_11570 [delta proteobacterium ML8_D]